MSAVYFLLARYMLGTEMFSLNIHCLCQWFPNCAKYWNHLVIF